MTSCPNHRGHVRIMRDVTALIRANFEVERVNGFRELLVKIDGPLESVYQGGIWFVRVELPEKYPTKSPSISFATRIFHPNIDEASGAVCINVLNQTWTPLYNLLNVFQVFIPQLLRYPNALDPLNNIASKLLLSNKQLYEQKVKQHINEYASHEKYLEMKNRFRVMGGSDDSALKGFPISVQKTDDQPAEKSDVDLTEDLFDSDEEDSSKIMENIDDIFGNEDEYEKIDDQETNQ